MSTIKEHFEVQYESADKKFDGIITHLRLLTGQNPSKNGLIKILSPTKSHFEFPLTNLFEYGDLLNKSFWNFSACDPRPNENWILFDFKESHSILLSSYTIRSGGSSHPKSWKFEGSNDKIEWSIIHEVRDCNYLNCPRATHTFVINDYGRQKSQPKFGYRFVRFVQIENMSQKNEKKYRINLKAIEFFGDYYTVE